MFFFAVCFGTNVKYLHYLRHPLFFLKYIVIASCFYASAYNSGRRASCFWVVRPANSTDLNPLDYKRWGEMHQQVYQDHDADELKQRLINVWHGFEQSVINDAGDKWRKRLCVGIRVKVGNFEHLI